MGTLGFLLLIVIAVVFFRRMLIRLVLLVILATVGYNAVMSQMQQTVSAGVASAGSIPSQLLAMARDTIMGFFGEGRAIMDPLIGAANEGTELYEYCLADVTWVRGKVNPSTCEALPRGPARTKCFEDQLASVTSLDGISDLTQIDDIKENAENQCSSRFKVTDAMPTLLGAGVRGVGQLYRYCEIPGACEESAFDNVPYRDCLKDKFESAPPEGLGLTGTYCGVYRTSEDREKWRKCVEVSMVQQTAGIDMALVPNDPNQPAIRAIRACRQL
jgi:hypothetical protein